MKTRNILLRLIISISLFASWPGAMIRTYWLEVPLSRTYFHDSKGVRAIEFLLYLVALINEKLFSFRLYSNFIVYIILTFLVYLLQKPYSKLLERKFTFPNYITQRNVKGVTHETFCNLIIMLLTLFYI